MPQALPLACCVEGPEHAVAAHRYALTELLHGLGLTPVWTSAGEARLYAGARPEHAREHALRLRLGDASDRERPADVAALGWLDHAGRRTPLPVGPAGTPAADARAVVEADVLGSAFWWLAGVQETATVARDVHGRFPYSASLQHALGTAAEAPVDALRLWLGDALRTTGVHVPGRTWGGASWAVALSHDLDAVRTPRLRAFVGEAVRGRPRRALARALGPDARAASVEALVALARRHDARSTLFVKTVGPGSPEDVPYRIDAALRARLRGLAAEGFEVGLHPGYASHDHGGRLAAERARLAEALGAPPAAVRSHFLRWHEPTTQRLYARAGFRLDSTLGFAETTGFRRGTCHPFRLWDAGAATDLWELPLAAMDTALFTHLGLSDGDAAARLAAVFAEARRAGGVAVVLWHPAMDADPAWARRLGVLDRALTQARADGAAVGPLGALLSAWTGGTGRDGADQPSP